jgi:hypothetical protein
MFSPNPKNDPLLSAIKGVIAENDKHRDAVDRANDHFKITDKRQLPHNLHAEYDALLKESNNLSEKITKSTPMGDVISDFEKSDAPQFEDKSMEKRRQMAIAAKMSMNEALKGNQHKIDANKNNRIDAHDFKLLRNKNMTAEDVMKEALANISEKDSLSEAELNILMELDVTDTEVMNSDLYKNAVKSVKDPRKIQVGQDVEGLGKFEPGDNIFNKVREKLASQKAAPVPMPRNARPATPVPVANVEPAPAARPMSQKPANVSGAPRVERGIEVPAGETYTDQVFDADALKKDIDAQSSTAPASAAFSRGAADAKAAVGSAADQAYNAQSRGLNLGNQGSQPYWGAKPAPAAAPVVPATPVRATKSIQQIGQEIQNSTLSGYREIQHSGPSNVAKGRKLNEANEGSDEGTLTMQRYAKMFRGKR